MLKTRLVSFTHLPSILLSKHSSSTQAPWTWHLDLKDVLGLEGVQPGPSSPGAGTSPSTAPALGSIKGVASLEEMERVGKPDPLMRSLDELGDEVQFKIMVQKSNITYR